MTSHHWLDTAECDTATSLPQQLVESSALRRASPSLAHAVVSYDEQGLVPSVYPTETASAVSNEIICSSDASGRDRHIKD